jgi:Mannosyltransferase (PIG-V)
LAAPFHGVFPIVTQWLRTSAVREALRVALLTRIAIFAVGYVSVITIGHPPQVAAPPADVRHLPDHWDARWYVGLAHGGYRWEGPGQRFSRIAFFPAYALALRAAGAVLRLPDRPVPWLWTGVGLSVAFFWIGLFYVFRLSATLTSDAAAVRAIALLAAYPFAMFFGQVYTESLFLAAAAGSVYHLVERQVLRSIVWGIVAGLCRPTGCLVMLMLASVLLQPLVRERKGAHPWSFLGGVAVASPAIGTLIFSAWVRYVTGSWLAWLTEQATWGRNTRNIWQLAGGIWRSIAADGLYAYATSNPYDLLNMLAGVFALIAVLPVARRLGLGFGLFVLLSVAAPLYVGGLPSMGRYTAVLFPIFMWMSTVGRQDRPSMTMLSFAMGQATMAALFFTDRPVF